MPAAKLLLRRLLQNSAKHRYLPTEIPENFLATSEAGRISGGGRCADPTGIYPGYILVGRPEPQLATRADDRPAKIGG
jgi:hypothetical protein